MRLAAAQGERLHLSGLTSSELGVEALPRRKRRRSLLLLNDRRQVRLSLAALCGGTAQKELTL